MGRKTALEDNGQEGTKRLKELSINTQGNDGIHTAAAVCLCAADGGVGGSWPQRRKVNLDTTENNPFPLAVSAITGGRRLGEGWREGKRRREGGRKGREKGRRERKGGGSVLSAEDFLPCLYMVSSPPFFRLPSPDSDKNSEPPIVPAGWQTAPVTRTGGSHVSNCPQNAILMS